ncbi:SRPBCC domain-containing protein [Devosia nitrariae]|uniref:Activator of HSP90 ATPase n=1 Tax=Devosia nitrariae TaxID=2071872 RepID=A0ABQ5W011_9HYPH|nr:SRPBCC domain-containing protein [Devosia nitrariae]GLQ53402.1 activator of HSP90 ATPase [Devosia nitrariae]
MLARTEKLAENELLIEREFEAPRALVWRIWSDAEHLKRWFGPTDFTCPVFELDFREGGRYRAVIRSDEHGEYWFGGTFREIRPNEKIVMNFAWEEDGQETTITVTLAERDGKTVQSFHQTPFASVESRDGHLGGWIECLDKGRVYAEDFAGRIGA